MYLRFKTLKFGCRVGSKEDRADPFQGGSRVVIVLSDSKSEEWEKTVNTSLESCSRYWRKLKEFRFEFSLQVQLFLLTFIISKWFLLHIFIKNLDP